MGITVEITYSALRGVNIPGSSFRIEIDSEINEASMKKLIRDYRDKEEKTSEEGFITFLEKNNIRARILKPTYKIEDYS